MSRRILLVDDHAMFRAGVRLLVQGQDRDALIEEAGDAATASARVAENVPDLVVMDLHLPDRNGVQLSEELLSKYPALKIIMLSAESDLQCVNDALRIGISGYLFKESAPEELALAMASVLAGKIYLSTEANAAVLEQYRRGLSAEPDSSKPLLSGREREVLCLIAEGLRTKEIAVKLNVGAKTAETYRRRLMQKLGCTSTAELVRYAMREGFIQP